MADAREQGNEKTKVNVKFIYIAEAHAVDEWPIGDHLAGTVPALKQHRSLQERIKVAQRFYNEFLVPQSLPQSLIREEEIFVDNPETDEVEKTLHPWPTAWFIINPKGELVYRTITRQAFFPRVSEVRQIFMTLLQSLA